MGCIYSIYYILIIRRWQDWGLPSTALVVANLRVLFVWQHDPDRCFGSGNEDYQTLWRLVSDHKLHSGFLKVLFPNPFRDLLWFKLLNCQLAQESHQSCRQLKKKDIIGDAQILRSSIAKNALNITGIDMNAMYIYIWLYFHYLLTLDLY